MSSVRPGGPVGLDQRESNSFIIYVITVMIKFIIYVITVMIEFIHIHDDLPA